ncbi:MULTISPECIES: CinA family protein [Pseudomonas]|jgi:nicotinamide-nucleotide amidase|uniref:CinA family protein n=1 Tax=Pseudomonas rhodesiae TaxID=76760 RepID=A0A8I1JF57_9PSED|nr:MULTISPECIES: CinA family protein [Pseudomonas]MBI6605550.1 CinA family protein [Pseudomonas sp. S4_EA_1b]MBI6627498.1 CinA family protein [Pseudomonas rhodesiae]NMY82267.1 CinA family protein [Pseudomonas rhodesiae]PHN35317.1 ompetence-damaged protein [Pseudomonas sp. ICMP 564]WHT79208.1 Nicotinamide-nucleotide amidohydrolase PncC [Pseudomonas rhodesiae]
MSIAAATIDCLKQHRLLLTTAESCTAGKIITLLSQVEGSGACIECGYVVYSEEAKQRLLGVSAYTIKTFNLTSCEVAREMAQGALRDSPAQVAVATTGLLGPDSIDGIPPGTVCFAWAYHLNGAVKVFSRKERFIGSREQVQVLAAEYALKGVARFLDEAVGR